MYKTLLFHFSIWYKGVNAGVKEAPPGLPEREGKEKKLVFRSGKIVYKVFCTMASAR